VKLSGEDLSRYSDEIESVKMTILSLSYQESDTTKTNISHSLPHVMAATRDPAPLPQRDRAAQFSAHICCGQMAAWIKMPLDMEVGFGN